MAAGPIGPRWGVDTWSDTAWQVGTWYEGVTPEAAAAYSGTWRYGYLINRLPGVVIWLALAARSLLGR